MIVSRCFTLYLSFWLLMYSCWDYHFRGSYIFCFICFLFHCLLTYIHDVIHWYLSLFCVLWSQERILFSCIFHTCVYVFCLVFQEKYRLIQLSCCLHLQLMDSSLDWICCNEHVICKGLFLCKRLFLCKLWDFSCVLSRIAKGGFC